MEYKLPGSDSYPNVEVAGEAYREREIVQAIGRSPKLDEEIEVTLPASIIPEPDNPFDKNALSVRIRGNVVGYIEKDQTAPYLNAVQRITASGHTAMTIARVWAVRRTHWEDGTRFYSRISVVLPWNGISLPENDPPLSNYSILPWGSALQVTGEQNHFDVLLNYIPATGEGLVIATLHRGEKTLKSGSTREVVEVRVDGKTIGELTAATSRHFLPTIDYVRKQGVDVAVWAKIKGSAVSAEVTIQGAKASELSSTWFSGTPTILPRLVPQSTQYDLPAAYVPQPAQPKPASQKARKVAHLAATQTAKKSGCLTVVIAGAGIVIGFGTIIQQFV